MAEPARWMMLGRLFVWGAVAICAFAPTASAQVDEAHVEADQSRESMANDATASQWTFQLAWEGRTWRDDTLSTGVVRPEGNRSMVQLRLVAPLTKEKTGLPFTILNRLTFRNNEAADKSSGAGNAELFSMIIPLEWATGRFAIGPQVNFPVANSKFGLDVWRFGFASAGLQRLASDKVLTGILVQQTWGKTNPMKPNDLTAQPITIQPVLNWSLPKSFYLNIGETAASYDWQAKEWLVPLGIRFGKLWVGDTNTWNLYGEYRTTVVYEDWPGSAIKDAFRVNVSYTIPI